MKSPYEILIEEKTARILREAKQKKWDRLSAIANASLIWPITTAVIWCCFFGFVGFNGALTENPKSFLGAGGVFAFNLIYLFSVTLRREMALREMIREEAPDLFAKLGTQNSIRLRREKGMSEHINA